MKRFLSIFGIIGILLFVVFAASLKSEGSSFIDGIKDLFNDGPFSDVTEEPSGTDVPVPVTFTATFEPGLAEGESIEMTLNNRDVLILPGCNYTPPEDMVFSYWESNNLSYLPDSEYVMRGDTVFTAAWKYYVPANQYGINVYLNKEFELSFDVEPTVFYEESYNGVVLKSYKVDTVKSYLHEDGNYYVGFFKDGIEVVSWSVGLSGTGYHQCWIELSENCTFSEADQALFNELFEPGSFSSTDENYEDFKGPPEVPNTIDAGDYKYSKIVTNGEIGVFYAYMDFTSNGEKYTGIIICSDSSGYDYIAYGNKVVYSNGVWVDESYKNITLPYSFVATDAFYEVFLGTYGRSYS